MAKKILIALGGNALLRAKEEGTFDQQVFHVRHTCRFIHKLIEEGYHVGITHGNGPQVGAILLKNEIAKDKLPPMPLDACGAQSQGLIGYMIQRELHRITHGEFTPVTILTQTLVDAKDTAFKNPTKPIGLFYTEKEADKLKKMKRWHMVHQAGKGYRRVVPSPKPIDIVEGATIKKLFQQKQIIVACGGGGIPVIKKKNGTLEGVEAVIDKDLTGACLARIIGADIYIILTDVEKVAINFHQPNQQNLDKLSLKEAQKYLDEGQFAKGSMGPKVTAMMNFIEKGGKKGIITSLEKCLDAIKGKTGTHFKAK